MALIFSLLRRRVKLPSSSSLFLHPNSHPLHLTHFSSSSSPPKLPPLNPSSRTHLQDPTFFPPIPAKTDFDSDFEEPTTSFSDPELPILLNLISQSKSKALSQQEALQVIRTSFGSEPSKRLVCSALWGLRWDWESAFLVFLWGSECVSDCLWAWRLMIWVLGKNGRFDLAWRVVRRMHRRSILNRGAMVVLMERYAAANESSKAIKTFHAMEKFKIDADSTAFYALLCALCKNKNVEEAEELLLLNRKFYPLEAGSFNIILNGWCNIIVDIAEAKRVWREMSNCCITPDGTSYTHMISCFSKVGNLFDSLRLYDEMKRRGWVPNLVVYNALIYVLTREKCLKDAHNIFDKIVQEGLEPDVQTYNSMICPLCENHELEEAHRIMDNMIKRNIAPTIETYHAFAKAESIDGTLRLIKKMSDVGCGPNGYTFSLILAKFIRMNECGNALQIWSEMRRNNVIPESSHYTQLIEGLIQHGWILKALELHNEMKSKGLPNHPKFEKIFEAFISENKNHWGRGKEYIARPHGKNKNLERTKIY
ncbi:hypothetical protein J5N97_008192 [Dioscorea zingiberensis]|uniref:Pentatricopeptide repeat-containing protein n=1 Tax=Dioscorea zingiberensis TaxID=325984 RepID=A0A9D5HVP2_9LILI|nr:hypothetical protein J5N97_008192 [Dioscorea zingiberensis]